MGIARRLKEIGQALDSIVAQKDLVQSLSNTENAQKLNCLVEDIQGTLMGYQVRTPEPPGLIVPNNIPDLIAARDLQ